MGTERMVMRSLLGIANEPIGKWLLADQRGSC